jgi:hypothetical protein
VDEMEWRGLKSQAAIYRQRGSKLSPASSRVDYGVRFFLVEDDIEEIKASIEDDVEEATIHDDSLETPMENNMNQ